MNYVNKSQINNFLSRYQIGNTEENFKKLEQVIDKRDFAIYKQILYMIDNCRVIEEDSVWIIIEIDLLEHATLLEDLTNKFFQRNWVAENSKRKLVTVILFEMCF